MANALGTLFGDIASAIREKTGDTATMKPAQFPEKISAIESGGGSGGNLPAGIYAQKAFPIAPNPTFRGAFFVFKGELYHFTMIYAITGSKYPPALYKLVDGTWTLVSDNCGITFDPSEYAFIEVNGKLRAVNPGMSSNYLADDTFTFEKKTSFTFYPSYIHMLSCVYNDEWYFIDYYDNRLCKWVESSDTVETVMTFSTSVVKSREYSGLYLRNGEMYVFAMNTSNVLCLYRITKSNTLELVSVLDFTATIPPRLLAVFDQFAYISDNLDLYKYRFDTGEFKYLGKLMTSAGRSNSLNSDYWYSDGKNLRCYSMVAKSSGFYTQEYIYYDTEETYE